MTIATRSIRILFITLFASILVPEGPVSWAGDGVQNTTPTEESLRTEIDKYRERVREATPRGGRTPQDVLADFAEACERYVKHYPDGPYAANARSTFLSCVARLDEPKRLLSTIEHWLASGIVPKDELARTLRVKHAAYAQLQDAEHAKRKLTDETEWAREYFVRLLLLQAENATSHDARLAVLDQALAAAGDTKSLRAEALAMRGLTLLEMGGEEGRARAAKLLEEAAALDSRATSVIRLQGTMRARQAALAREDLAPGSIPSDFTLKNIRTKEEVTLSELRGKVVLLDFWATWCGPCIRLMDTLLVDLHREYRDDGFMIVGIGTNWRNTAEDQLEWANQKDQPLMTNSQRTRGECDWIKVFDAKGETTKAYGVEGIPFCVLIDREGKVVVAGNGHALAGDIRAYVEKSCAANNGGDGG